MSDSTIDDKACARAVNAVAEATELCGWLHETAAAIIDLAKLNRAEIYALAEVADIYPDRAADVLNLIEEAEFTPDRASQFVREAYDSVFGPSPQLTETEREIIARELDAMRATEGKKSRL